MLGCQPDLRTQVLGPMRKETPVPLHGKEAPRGAWLAQSVEHLDLGVVSSSPTVGVEIT